MTAAHRFAIINTTKIVAIKRGGKNASFIQIAVRLKSVLYSGAELSEQVRQCISVGKGDRRFGQIHRKDHAYAFGRGHRCSRAGRRGRV